MVYLPPIPVTEDTRSLFHTQNAMAKLQYQAPNIAIHIHPTTHEDLLIHTHSNLAAHCSLFLPDISSAHWKSLVVAETELRPGIATSDRGSVQSFLSEELRHPHRDRLGFALIRRWSRCMSLHRALIARARGWLMVGLVLRLEGAGVRTLRAVMARRQEVEVVVRREMCGHEMHRMHCALPARRARDRDRWELSVAEVLVLKGFAKGCCRTCMDRSRHRRLLAILGVAVQVVEVVLTVLVAVVLKKAEVAEVREGLRPAGVGVVRLVLKTAEVVEGQAVHLLEPAVLAQVMKGAVAPFQTACERSVVAWAASCQSAGVVSASCLYSTQQTMVSSPSVRQVWDSVLVDFLERVVRVELLEVLAPTLVVVWVLSFAMFRGLRGTAHCPDLRQS